LIGHSRQSFSALEITNILSNDIASELTILPWVPYAVSLSLSTMYRQVRHSRVLNHRKRALDRVEKNYSHLQKLKDFSWSATLMAELARKALLETGDLSQLSDTDHTAKTQRHVAVTDPQDESQIVPANTLGVNGQLHDADNDQPLGQDGNQISYYHPVDLWNIDQIGDMLEGNLDLSVPNFFQDYSLEQLDASWGL